MKNSQNFMWNYINLKLIAWTVMVIEKARIPAGGGIRFSQVTRIVIVRFL